MLRVILLGAPGVGKGTQAAYLCKQYQIAHIATGDMLRDELARQTALGKQVKAIMERGELVPDDIVVNMMKGRVSRENERGFLLDGFPRSLPQARAMRELGIEIDCVIEIDVPDDLIIARLSRRRVHPASGRVYHLEHNPPQREGVDDETGEPLIQRADDNADTVAERLRVYHEQTQPLSEYYQNEDNARDGGWRYAKVDGSKSVEEVRGRIDEAVRQVLARDAASPSDD